VFAEYPAVAAQLEARQLRALATAAPARFEPLLDVPTVSESGYPGFAVDVWWGVLAPALTPADTVSQLAGAFSRAVEAPEIRAKLTAAGFYPALQCGADFGAYLHRQSDDYGRIIRETNIRAE
jgi:tripartite-type tricarboxylate transporter receptor subunit TctC